MSNNNYTTFALCAALAASCALQASAGTTGSISGKVVDATGAPVVATVKAVSASQTVNTVTDKSGQFHFSSLGPDYYTITVSKKGYAATAQVDVFADEVESIDLQVGKPMR